MAESEIKVTQELTEKRVPITRENVKYQGGGGGAVNSVNGQTGDVVLTAEDVGALPDTTEIPTNVSELTNDAGYQTASEVASAVAGEATLRQSADNNLQSQIDAISASSDVTDIVGTYAELQAYDTSTLGDKDIIKVLQDESRNDETTYYRWSTTTHTFTLIGEEGPYYTKSQADGRFVAQTTYATDKAALEDEIDTKQDELTAGSNIQISGNVISATDTTYSDFTGTDGQTAGTAGLVPAPATTDADKFLKSDGTWDTAGSAINVVQTTGTSTTDVMSQKAATNMIWPEGYETSHSRLVIAGSNASVTDTGGIIIATGHGYETAGQYSVAIGEGAMAIGYNSTALGMNARTATGANYNTVVGSSSGVGRASSYSTAIGYGAYANAGSAVSLGYKARATRLGEVNIGAGTSTDGYNSTSYRVLGGVHDPVDLHDAATKNYVDNVAISFAAISGATAPTTATEGKYVGQLYYDTANDTMYYLSSIDDTQTPVEYNWNTFGGGSSVNVVQTIGTSTTDVMSQDATSKMIWPVVADTRVVSIGGTTNAAGAAYSHSQVAIRGAATGQYSTAINGRATGPGSVAIGENLNDKAAATDSNTIAIGGYARASSSSSIAIGASASTESYSYSIALGSNARNGRQYEVSVGHGGAGDPTRFLANVTDPALPQDAATKHYLDQVIIRSGTAAPTTSTVGEVGTLYAYVESGTGHLAICTAVSGTTYTWQTLI